MVTVRCLLELLILYIGVTETLSLSNTTFFSENNLTATDDVSVLTSPGYPNNYRSMNCTWIIEASNESAVVYVKVLWSSIGGNSNSCGYDSVTAYDGPSTNSPLLKKWCGTQTPNMTTTGSYLTLHFLSSGSLEGFNLTFQQKPNDSDKCGEDLTAESHSKELTSPGYPNIYSKNLKCTWTISTIYTNIKLVVTDALLETSSSCEYDRVQIFDGLTNEILGIFCGSEKPTYISSSSTVRIDFITDRSVQYRGFKMLYKGGHFNGSQCSSSSLTAYSYSQYLTSPGYPQDYSNNLECKWSITATSSSYNIKLIITDANIESSSSCSSDSVKVYNGPSIYSSVLGTFCGSRKPTYVSSGSHVTVTFKTDGSRVSGGFKMSYQSGHFSDPQTCGTTRIRASSSIKYFTSPGYPSNYGSNLNCKWIISAYYSYNIKLVAVSSDIESSFNCVRDSVKVFDGGWTTSSRLLGKFCGTQTPSFVSTSYSMTVTFTTDVSSGRGGFRLSYQAGYFSAAQCSPSSLTAYSYPQYLTSPGHPQDYSNNLDCKWSITATSSSYNIKLIVTEADIDSTTGCSSDSVKIYDGPTIYSSILGTFCGSQKPTYVSSGSHVTVTFKTNGFNVAGGFKMSYRSGRFNDTQCSSSSLTAYSYSQHLTSPGYPLDYSNNLDCKWSITATSSNYNIKLIVIAANIESSSDCSYDSVKIYDGYNTYSSVLGTFCGSQKPTYVSSSNHVTVTFKTDGSNVAQGFKMSYQSGHFSEGSSCTNTELTSYEWSNEITSPFYPGEYPNNAECTWTIDSGNSHKVVYIEITSLDIQYAYGCYSDYLQAFDGRYGYGSSLGKWCGTEIPSAQHSTGQYMYITFHSDSYHQGTGFKLQYSTTSASKFNKSGVIIGGIAGGSVLIIGIACFIFRRARMAGRRTETQGESNPRPGSQQPIYIIGGNRRGRRSPPATFVPPPSYDEVVGNDPAHQGEAPPPYSSLGTRIIEVSTLVAENSGVDACPNEEADDVNDAAGPEVDVPDTLPILTSDNMPRTCQGQDNAAAESEA